MATRWLAVLVAMAVLLGLGGIRAAAQVTESGVPEGAIDGASVSYREESGDDPLAPNYSFAVFTVEDEEAAIAAMDTLPRQIAQELSAGPDGGPGAELVEVDEVDGLDDLADGATAYRVAIRDDAGSLTVDFLTIVDGSNVHYWISFVLDFDVTLGEGAPGDATAVATPMDPNQGVEDLLGIAERWFDGDKPDDGDLIDQLPTAEQFPDGYVEAERYENLDDFTDGAAGIPARSPAA